MNPDFTDLLCAYVAADVEASPENAARVMRALATFGAPMSELSEADFASEGVTYQIGVPPGRIDLLTELTGLSFAEAWPDRLSKPFGDVEVGAQRAVPRISPTSKGSSNRSRLASDSYISEWPALRPSENSIGRLSKVP